jgi:class 3 adenylate cyclase
MFCDLVGSTALSSRLNPEDLREFIAAYHLRTVAGIVAGSFLARHERTRSRACGDNTCPDG